MTRPIHRLSTHRMKIRCRTSGGAWRGLGAAVGLHVLAACTPPPPGGGVNDPYEAGNRQVHGFNVALDRAVFGPDAGPSPLPAPVTRALSNFTENLSTPSYAANSLLQARPEPLANNVLRFAVNTTFGIGGLFDPATALGLPREPTDFGETLHVWGAPEGAFLMVPVIGPSTERDLVGRVVDVAFDPLGAIFEPPQSDYLRVIALGNKVNQRLVYSDTVSSVLYESADSYTQSRILYLENRNFQLGVETEVIDPYEDPYAQ
jgi:phospholipid-binding lipoprotein MlaA